MRTIEKMSGETQVWTGNNGTEYFFYVYPRHPEVPSRLGLYIYTGKNAEGYWAPLYIGYGDLAIRANNDRSLIARIDAKGATHVHLRLNSNPADGLREMADLLERYQNAFEPLGCNLHGPDNGKELAPFETDSPERPHSVPDALAASHSPAKDEPS
jgi:hypothetical protein